MPEDPAVTYLAQLAKAVAERLELTLRGATITPADNQILVTLILDVGALVLTVDFQADDVVIFCQDAKSPVINYERGDLPELIRQAVLAIAAGIRQRLLQREPAAAHNQAVFGSGL